MKFYGFFTLLNDVVDTCGLTCLIFGMLCLNHIPKTSHLLDKRAEKQEVNKEGMAIRSCKN